MERKKERNKERKKERNKETRKERKKERKKERRVKGRKREIITDSSLLSSPLQANSWFTYLEDVLLLLRC